MSHRLQVLIPEDLDRRLAQAAARRRVSKGEFVRTVLESALIEQLTSVDPVARLGQINAPTADLEQMLAEVDSRYE